MKCFTTEVQSTATLYYLCTNILGRNAQPESLGFDYPASVSHQRGETSFKMRFEGVTNITPTEVKNLRCHLKFMVLPV